MSHVYWGADYSERAIQDAVEKHGVKAEYAPDIERRVAALLAAGAVVARFDGRMEYGPRALGNRSILSQATDTAVNDWLNKRLRRTEFMPFAPVTLHEWGDQCYGNLDGARDSARFMTMTFNCTSWMRQVCPAVTHVDGTARPQILEAQHNPGYYAILDAYRQLTGLPSLINTSFNVHEEPMVCSPDDAIRAFLDSGLDALVMGNTLVRAPAATPFLSGRQ